MAGMLRVVRSTSAKSRLAAAAEFLESRSPLSEVIVIGASRGPADDLARLLTRIEAELSRSAIDDRAALFSTATEAWRSGRATWTGLPLILLDVTIDSLSEQEFVRAIVERASTALATVPDGDVRAV